MLDKIFSSIVQYMWLATDFDPVQQIAKLKLKA